MFIRIVLRICCAVVLGECCTLPANATTGPGPQKTEIAAGVYQFVSPDIAGNVNGNSVAIVTERDILVFDTDLLPSSAHDVLQEIRKLTRKPVRYVVNSHWHPDHSGGNEIYVREFPDLEIIATSDTRRLMENTMAVYVKTLEYEAALAFQNVDDKTLTAKDREELQAQRQQEDSFLAEYKSAHPKLPTLTFDDTLTLYHGGREFQLMHLVGHTSGDLALYLPVERILLTGDLLAYPVPFCADSHPSRWISSLETLSRLNATTIIPGHGEAQHDQAYLNLVLNSLQTIHGQVQAALRRGLTLKETLQSVNLDAIRLKFTHDDPELNASFDGNFTPIVRQMYDEDTEGLELYQ